METNDFSFESKIAKLENAYLETTSSRAQWAILESWWIELKTEYTLSKEDYKLLSGRVGYVLQFIIDDKYPFNQKDSLYKLHTDLIVLTKKYRDNKDNKRHLE